MTEVLGLERFVGDLSRLPFRLPDAPCWQVIGQIEGLLQSGLRAVGSDYSLLGRGIAVHRSARIAASAELTGPVILGPGSRGARVNLEAGVVLANHYNERQDRSISVFLDGNAVPTGLVKFGAILGDGCRIGANSVTSPGTLLAPGAVVPRLTLVDQLAPSG